MVPSGIITQRDTYPETTQHTPAVTGKESIYRMIARTSTCPANRMSDEGVFHGEKLFEENPTIT